MGVLVEPAGYIGELEDAGTFDFYFSTHTAAGVMIALVGTPVLSVYKDNNTTATTTGPTLSVDFNSLTGLNQVRLVLTDGFYVTATDYAVVITTGTVDSVTVIGEVVATFSIKNRVTEADVVAISSDTTAANNLELMYDGTGYVDDTAPASRAQVDNIGSASGGSLNFANNLDNIDASIKSITFEGVETSGTNASVDAEEGTRHVIDDSSNNIDIVYRFDIGGGRTATELTFKGFLNGSNDVATIQVYNGSSFDTLFTLDGKNGSTNDTVSIPLLSKYTGTSTDIGLVFIRIECASQSNPTLNIDQLLVAAVNIGQSVGYSDGAVWIDTVDGVSGTESFVNGTADNPASSLANAITIASAVNLHRFFVAPGSSITFAEGHTNETWFGSGWALALGGRDVSDSHFSGADVSGTATTPTGEAHFDHCEIGDATLGEAHIDGCDLKGTITLSAAAEYFILGCYHARSTSPVVDFGSGVGDTVVHVHDHHGALTVNNMGQSSSTDVLHFSSGDANLTLASSCIAGTVNLNGTFKFTNSGSGLTVNDEGAIIQIVADQVWDEVMVQTTGAPAITGTFRAAMEWMFGLSRNKITQTSTTTTLRNDADDGDLATSTVSDDATTYTRGEWST